ncbi:unnamed protein product [Meloidogyne enterolobii]|uniref:Uncharacterized protein n=1 Tax=Meloidogyne enterolobii TaxID=390850 RepID=A0ACB0XR11_MELEN
MLILSFIFQSYDIKLAQYHDNIISAHGQRIKDEFRRQIPQPKNGAQIVTEELEALNRRFAQLSSVILERKNIVNVLIQNWRRKQQVDKLFLFELLLMVNYEVLKIELKRYFGIYLICFSLLQLNN